jgi:hypothetical protein
MTEPSSISREHRMRVLENQAKIAAERSASVGNARDPQLKIPLIVEVKRSATKPPPRRTRRKPDPGQPDLGDL